MVAGNKGDYTLEPSQIVHPGFSYNCTTTVLQQSLFLVQLEVIHNYLISTSEYEISQLLPHLFTVQKMCVQRASLACYV